MDSIVITRVENRLIENAIAQWDAVTDDLIWIDGLKGTYWGIFTRASVDLLSWLKYLG